MNTSTTHVSPHTTTREIAFIDPNVGDIATLVQGMRPGVEAIVLAQGQPALDQIADELRDRAGLQALHLIAHGRPGEVAFAGGVLDACTLDAQRDALRVIGQSLGADGDIRLWSCDTGAGVQGRAFVRALADAAGAHVSAADRPLGGGCWELERRAGAHPARPPIAARAQAAYAPTLAIVLDLDGAGAGTSSTAFTEQTEVTLFPSATIVSSGVDTGLVSQVVIDLTGQNATTTLALNAAAALVATGAGVTAAYVAATGILTLSYTSPTAVSDASWQAIVRGIVFNDTSDAPPAGPITLAATATSTLANTGPDTHSITITSVNDAPFGTDKSISTNEDTNLVFTTADFGFSDLDGNTLNAVRITQLPTNGALTLNNLPVADGDIISLANITGGLLAFVPDANENGTAYTTFKFRVRDNGGTANGGDNLADTANTMTIDVNAVNDAPDGADSTVTAQEDQAYSFTLADFGFSDVIDGHTINGVRITSLPTAGSIKLNGAAMMAGDIATSTQIGNGQLQFTAAANAFDETAYASFTFQVRDNGGTNFGGVNLDPVPNTMTIDVLSRPDVSSVVVTPALVTDANAASDMTVAVTFDEAMDNTVMPTIAFGPDLGATLALGAGAWSNGNLTFTRTYTIADDGMDADGVDVIVSGGQNAGGRLQDEQTSADEFDVDMQNPTVLSVEVNDTTVGPQNVGSPFRVIVTFSEAMDPLTAPAIALTAQQTLSPTHLVPTGGAWSLGNTVYTYSYSVIDIGVDIGDVMVGVSGAKDAVGNAQLAYIPAVEFDFDTFHFQGDAYANNLMGNNYSHWFLGDNSVDTLKGGTANDTLDGGQWGDSMAGGNGSDVYYVDNVNDKAVETTALLATGGTDLVYSTVNFILGLNVENLALTGSANIQGKGNTLNNDLDGNSGNNLLTGLGGLDTLDGGMGNDSLSGGAGNDSLIGGGGSDTFVFDTALNAASNVDTIAGFEGNGGDKIRLVKTIFGALSTGTLAASAWHVGAVADQPADRILYSGGNLYYDRDGSITTYSPVLFATLTGVMGTFDHNDFVVTLV